MARARPEKPACFGSYTLFPNFHPWGAYNRIVYRFRPNGDRHDSSIMEVLFVAPFAGERPAPAQITWLSAEEPFVSAPELGLLAKVFDQDVTNMTKVQKGMIQSHKKTFTLSAYQEGKLRWFHRKLDQQVRSGAASSQATRGDGHSCEEGEPCKA